MSLPKPYYEDSHAVIYHSDCREILPHLPKVDLVLTDPPYGIASKWKGGSGHGWGANRLQESVVRNQWDAAPPDQETLALVLGTGKDAIIWGGNYFMLPPSRCWLVWNKPERNFSLAEAELAWTSRDAVVRVVDANRHEENREHPTQKPLKVMAWCLSLFPEAKSILDPFMGSGTTLVAAKQLGRRAIGIELEEAYCRIAVQRLQQEYLPITMPEPPKLETKEMFT